MKRYSVGKYIALSISGLLVLSGGLIFTRLFPDAQGVLLTLPYICAGVGAGVFGGNLGAAISNAIAAKNPKTARQKEIDVKDERNRTISDKAKARTYDLLIYVYAAMLLAFALMQVDVYVILTLAAVYLFVIFSNVYYVHKFHREI